MKRIGHFLYAVALVGWMTTAAFAGAGYSAGNSAGSSFTGGLDSGDEVNSKLSQPLTSSTTKMSTFGDSSEIVQFDAQLTAPSTNSFLEILAQPGGNGDLVTVVIKQDLDFDGTADYAFSPVLPISGLCSNGVISCSAGTWNNCRYFTWKADSQLKISQVQLPSITGLSGCFCINISCGSNLSWTNMQYVLTTIGSGVIGFIQDTDSRVVVTGADTTLSYIKYYGQQTSDIGAAQSTTGVHFSGTTDPASIYADGDFSGDDEMIEQSLDPDSPYNTMVNAYSSRFNPREPSSCTIRRSVDFNEADEPYLMLSENCSTIDTSICTLSEEMICDYYGDNCVYSYQNESGTGLVPISNSVAIESPKGAKWIFDTNGSLIGSLRIDVTGNVSGTLLTGSNLWWSVKREYLCNTGISYSTADANSRAKTVAESADLQGNYLVYTDYGSDYNVELQFGEPISQCEKACKINKTITKTNVSTTGGTWEQVHDVTSTETIYKTCVEDECPVEPGETIKVDCTCMNDFTEATSIMQTIESAANDMICSGD